MNFKLRKICKLNMIIAVIMCVSLLFCFCSTSYVQAAESSVGDDYNKVVAFKDSLIKNGYMSYFDHKSEGWFYSPADEVKNDLSIVDLSTIDIPGEYGGVTLNTAWNSFVRQSGKTEFDMYVIAGGFYDTYSDSGKTYRRVQNIYILVPSDSLVCWGYNTEYCNKKGFWSQRIVSIASNTSEMFVFKSGAWDNETFRYHIFGYNTSSGSSGSNYVTFPSHSFSGTYCQVITDNKDGYDAPFTFTNMATVNISSQSDTSNMVKFLNGDSSVVTNADSSWSDKKEYLAESFYWDDMTCQVSSVGSDKYAFSFNYDYSCPLMVNPDELFSCDVIYNSDIRYQDGKGRIHTYTDSKQDMFSLNKHRKGYVNNSLCLNGQLKDSTGSIAYNSFLELMDGIVGIFGHVDTDLESNTDVTVKSAKLYVTVFLYHIPDPDRFFTDGNLGLPSIGGDEVPSDARVVQSTDVRYFSFDLFTLKPDQEVASKKPIVTTKDVTDDDGNVTDKKVTDVVATDDSGKTVINITIDNSNKVIDGNANVNTGGGSGSGDGDDEDKNSKSFWKYVSGIVALFTALLNSDSGLFAVIASYFKFIPKDFWSVTIGAIVVIAILSIYRLAKKGG